MSHRHAEKRDSELFARSQPLAADSDHEGGAKSHFGPTLAPRNILQLQRTIGNQAVLNLLAKQSNATIQREQASPETKRGVKVSPPWARVSSTSPLPGESVIGITDRQPPFTEKDREKLKDALLARHQENAKQGPDFAANFASALLEIWTGYVTENMEETADDASWSMLTKLVLFTLKEGAISLLFPPARLAMMTKEIADVMGGIKYVVSAAADLGQDAVENANTNSIVQKRGRELRNMTTGLSSNLQMVIRSAFDEVGDSFYYRDWLDNAPLDDLPLFRLPPAIPVISRDAIGVQIAQHLTSLLHDEEDTWVEKYREHYFLLGDAVFNRVKNGIFVKIGIENSSELQIADPVIDVPKVLLKELEGHAIGDMPDIPMYIEMQSLPATPFSKVEAEAIAELENAWPTSSPLVIKVPSNGKFYALSGGLREMFYLYSLTNPLADLGALAMEYTQVGDAHAGAAELYPMFLGSIEQGIQDLLDNSIKPLKIPKKAKQ